MLILSKDQQLDLYQKTLEMHAEIFGKDGVPGLVPRVCLLEKKDERRVGFLAGVSFVCSGIFTFIMNLSK